MAAPCPSTTSAAALPEALTAQILQHVPQEQRLQQCALTCKAWASAAALATVHVKQRFKSAQAISAFDSWLHKYADHLESLELSHSDCGTRLQLRLCKLAKLQRLQLEGLELLLPGQGQGSCSAGQDTHTSAPLLLPSLQHLQLSKVHLVSSSSLLQLARAPGLTSLKTKDISIAQLEFLRGLGYVDVSQKPHVEQLAADITGLLQKLPRLAVLELPSIPMSAAAMQQLGCMQGLQEVCLTHVGQMPMCELQHLSSSITHLHFQGNILETAYNSPSMPPQLQQLAGLLRLELHSCAVPPTVLGAFRRLQALKLWRCVLLPAPEEVDDVDEDVFETEGTAALLDALAGMASLQDLELSLRGLDTASTAPQRFAALTASTQLTRLAISPFCCIPLAQGAAQHMFPAGRQLPLLKQLTISPDGVDPDWAAADEWCIDGADLQRIATCCTALRYLDIGHTVQPGADLSGLLELPQSLCSLSVGGAAFGDAAAAVLGQLTQLEYLSLMFTPGFTDAGLEQLITLDLARLIVYDSGLSEAISQEQDGMIELDGDYVKGSVQEQLEVLCDLSPMCAPARLRRQKEANEQLQSDNQQLRSDKEHLCLDKRQLEAELLALRIQLELSQAHAQRLQQQLKAAQGCGDL